MQKLRVCFIGIGSIARRHIKNLIELCEEAQVQLRIDAYRHSVSGGNIEGITHVYHNPSEMPNDYDIVFITNPTKLHLSALEMFHDKGIHFFIEKPVVSIEQIEAARNFPLKRSSIYYVACPLRYNSVIRYIKENINTEEVISVRSISSSYLPDWRIGQDYRQTYSAQKKLGGGVDIDLIHEWDYLSYLFGTPRKMHSFIGKKSELEIDSNDYAIYIAEFEKMIAELHLDYFGRKTIREIQLFTNNDTIIGDLVNSKILFLKSGKIVEFHEQRDDFQKRELEYFLNLIYMKNVNENGYVHGLEVLELTQGKIFYND